MSLSVPAFSSEGLQNMGHQENNFDMSLVFTDLEALFELSGLWLL